MATEIDRVDPNNFHIIEYYKGLIMTNGERHVRVFVLWAVDILENLTASPLVESHFSTTAIAKSKTRNSLGVEKVASALAAWSQTDFDKVCWPSICKELKDLTKSFDDQVPRGSRKHFREDFFAEDARINTNTIRNSNSSSSSGGNSSSRSCRSIIGMKRTMTFAPIFNLIMKKQEKI